MLNAVEFNYFGRPRHLKIGLDALRAIEINLGISVKALLQNQEKFGFNAACVIISEGLRHEDPSMTTDKVSRWIEKYITEHDGENLITVMAKFEVDILEAIRVSGLFGELKVNDDGEWEPKNDQPEIVETVEEKSISE